MPQVRAVLELWETSVLEELGMMKLGGTRDQTHGVSSKVRGNPGIENCMRFYL